jgi:omega-6 fatty acid desaturase (delta-12 desaturase)
VRAQYPVVNDSVGLVFHSALLVPYFSWKFSHARHHAGTGSLERDEVFVPCSKAQHDAAHVADGFMATGPGRVLLLAGTLLVGWPLYLVRNAGSKKYAGRHADHFWPWSPVFKSSRERALVALSDAALLVVGTVLYRAVAAHGLSWMAKSYFAPYLMVNFWLVMITLLQHTHPSLPHFGGAEWEWLRGACCTVDRTYGALLNTLHHHIADTHVCHHLFSAMPHYHAQEATQALVKVLGPYYARDERNIFAALLADWRQCVYVDADEGGAKDVLWYRTMDGAYAKLAK